MNGNSFQGEGEIPSIFLININAVQSSIMKKNYYTYAYLREDMSPYYIGKGKGKRAYNYHTKFVKVPPKERILILKYFSTENDAYKHEIYMIAIFGRKDKGTGILINRTDGGDNPPKATGRVGWNKGKTMSFSKERNIKISLAHKGKKKSETHRKNLSKAKKGIPSPFKNKFKLSEKQIQELISSDNILELSEKWNVSRNYLYGLRRDLKSRGYKIKDARTKSKKKLKCVLLDENQLDILLNSPKGSIILLSEKWNISKIYLYNIRYKFMKNKDN